MSESSLKPTSSPPMFQTDFPPSEFAARRKKVFDRMGKNTILDVLSY